MTWPPPVRVGQEDSGEPACQLPRHLLEVEHAARTPGALDGELGTIEMMVSLQPLDNQIVEREPDRAAPVRVPAEETGAGFAGIVVHPVNHALHVDLIGMLPVDPR